LKGFSWNQTSQEQKHVNNFCVVVHSVGRPIESWAINKTHNINFIILNLDDLKKTAGKDPFQRTLEMFRYTIENFNCRYIFKVDDDTWVDVNNPFFNNKVHDIEYGGFLMNSKENVPFCSGGAGYLVRSDVAQLAVQACANERHEYEDVGMGICLKKNFGIDPKEIKGINPDTPEGMVHWYYSPYSGHISRFDPFVKPITFHALDQPLTYNRIIPKQIHLLSRTNNTTRMEKEFKRCRDKLKDWNFVIWTPIKIKKYKHRSKYVRHFVSRRIKISHLPSKELLLATEILYLRGGIHLRSSVDCYSFEPNRVATDSELFISNSSTSVLIGSTQYNPDLITFIASARDVLHKMGKNITSWELFQKCMVMKILFGQNLPSCDLFDIKHSNQTIKQVIV
jgi:hypothetical protein